MKGKRKRANGRRKRSKRWKHIIEEADSREFIREVEERKTENGWSSRTRERKRKSRKRRD